MGAGNSSVCARVLDLRVGEGEQHQECKPRGRAIVLDPRRISLRPLWNGEILDPNFPRWQDGSEVDEIEYKRCGEAGYPFHVWLRELLPAGSRVWKPEPAVSTKGEPSPMTASHSDVPMFAQTTLLQAAHHSSAGVVFVNAQSDKF